jgi:hypothetical protein
MITNVNARVLGNGSILVQYQQQGKAKDAGFSSWDLFIAWLRTELKAEN